MSSEMNAVWHLRHVSVLMHVPNLYSMSMESVTRLASIHVQRACSFHCHMKVCSRMVSSAILINAVIPPSKPTAPDFVQGCRLDVLRTRIAVTVFRTLARPFKARASATLSDSFCCIINTVYLEPNLVHKYYQLSFKSMHVPQQH